MPDQDISEIRGGLRKETFVFGQKRPQIKRGIYIYKTAFQYIPVQSNPQNFKTRKRQARKRERKSKKEKKRNGKANYAPATLPLPSIRVYFSSETEKENLTS